ncbi:MAG: protein kinase family protein [Gammaproteobacteria bacterium]
MRSTSSIDDKESALPEAVSKFFESTKSLLSEEEEKIIKEYVQQNVWAIRQAQEKGDLLKLSKSAALIKDADGKIRVIPPGAPKEEKMVPLSHGILMYVDKNRDVEAAVLSKRDEVNLFLGEGAVGRVKACPTIFKHKIVAVRTQRVITSQEREERETIKTVGGEIYITSGERASKKGMQKSVIVMDMLKETLTNVTPGFDSKHRKITNFKKLLVIAMTASDHLRHIHEQGYLHRDLSPNNIMLNGKGEAKIIDYGTSVNLKKVKTEKTPEGIVLFTDPKNTKPVTTEGFDAPEESRCQYCDRTDVYSLGVICSDYLCLVRFAPPEFRAEIQDLISRMRHEDLAKRPSAEEVHSKLNAVLQKYNLYEIKKLDEMKEHEQIALVPREIMDDFIKIIKSKCDDVELKEHNGDLQIILEDEDSRSKPRLQKMLKQLSREADGMRLLSVDWQVDGNVITVKGDWIKEMGKVFAQYLENQARVEAPDQSVADSRDLSASHKKY